MKKIISLYIILNLCQLSSVNSQNLVPNPSFEIDTACPNNYSQIYYAVPWFVPHTNWSSSDLFDTCYLAISSGQGVPFNQDGVQWARTGVKYAGIITYTDTINYREYIEVPLLSPLIVNRNYCVQIYISLSELSNVAISNIGAYFSIDSVLDSTHGHAIDYFFPQVENTTTNFLNDTANWMLVSGNFIANGGERFMTIGNFHNPSNTNVQNISGSSQQYSYYYLDDVSVIDCTDVGVDENNKEDMVEVYPNPATNQLTIKTAQFKEKEIRITDVLGNLIQQSMLNSHQSTIDISNLAKGIYFIELQTEKGILRRKFVKE